MCVMATATSATYRSRLSWFSGELSGGAISDYEPAESKVVTFECYWPETV
jgi:hypothetical protein